MSFSARSRKQSSALSRSGSLWLFVISISVAAGPGGALRAGELVFRPSNPAFGGNPNNSAHLLGTASAQNDFSPPAPEAPKTDPSALFVRQLQSRLLSGLSEQIARSILQEDPGKPQTGQIVLGNQTIDWDATGNTIELKIFDSGTGDTTTIKVPKFPGLPIGTTLN
jgi:curli production assembly/transport component CsgF